MFGWMGLLEPVETLEGTKDQQWSCALKLDGKLTVITKIVACLSKCPTPLMSSVQSPTPIHSAHGNALVSSPNWEQICLETAATLLIHPLLVGVAGISSTFGALWSEKDYEEEA